ncbi:MAG: ABC transporter substrate-binding protein [Burkholderiales bacterium]|nr:ABC transporter substrate-binding protein [Burkholderiales bacterium]
MASAWKSAAAVLTAALVCTPQPARSADINIVFAVPAQTLTFSAIFVAQDAGFFAKEGLKVELRNLVGVNSNNAVIAGSADFSTGTAATFLRAAAQGQRMFAIANMVDRPLVELVLRRDVAAAAGITGASPFIERAKALKGKTVAIQGVGSIVHAMQRLVANKAGLDPDKDMRIAPMDPPAMLPALRKKAVDGFATSLPFTTQAVVEGDAIMLASGIAGDLPEYLPFSYLVLYTRPEVCRSERDKCVRMARAFKGAAQFIQERPGDTLEVLKKRFPRLDPKLLAAAWEMVRKAHTADLRITDPGFINAQKFSLDAGLLEPKLMLRDFKGLYTDEFAK